MLKIIRDFFNGLALGITETIPGVSGGTIAIILGIYFEIIETINHFTDNLQKRLRFAIPILLGAATGIVAFSSLIHYLLEHFSFPTMLFFIGLITGIIPRIFFKINDGSRKIKVSEILLAVIPFLILVIISALKNASVVNPAEVLENITVSYMIFVFFAGIIAAAALVLPGISGSFTLLLLGIYPVAIYCISSVRTLFGDFTNTAMLLNICKVLVPLGIGVIIGGLSMVKLIEKILNTYHRIMYSIILGLLSGSICVLFKNPIVYKSGVNPIIVAIGIATFCIGCVLSFIAGKTRL